MFASILAVVSAFNLVCAGNAWHAKGVIAPKEREHLFRHVYRVDLVTKRYCRGDCEATREIAQITDTLLIFEKEERSALDDTIVYANRESGRYFDRRRMYVPPDNVWVDIEDGTCHRAPFTGFPVRRF